jgi:hypothetical protein
MRLLIVSLLVAVAQGFIGNGISHHLTLVTAAVVAASFAQAVTIEETVKKLEDELAQARGKLRGKIDWPP